MKAGKYLIIAACFTAVLLAGCGTREDTEPGTVLSPQNTEKENEASSATPSPKEELLSMDEAAKIAQADAGVAESELETLHARLNEGDAGTEYAVTFATADKSYQYLIAASNGTILEKSIDTIDRDSDTQLSSAEETFAADTNPLTPAPTPTTSLQDAKITQDEAVEIARKDAGVSESDMRNLEVKLDYEYGTPVYEIDFDAGNMEYEYDISITDGTILTRKSEPADHSQSVPKATPTPVPTTAPKATSTPVPTTAPKATSTPVPTTAPKATSTPVPTTVSPAVPAGITQDEAVEIARKDAGVSENEMLNLKVKLDYEDGISVYEIDFDAGNMEYEYEIAVSDGTIRTRKSELSDRIQSNPKASATPVPAAGITQDEAVEIARKDAGVSESDMRNLKVKLDRDDGISIYEIEFDAGNTEYEYEIAASDGTIRKKETDTSKRSVSGSTGALQTKEISKDEALAIVRTDINISEADMLDLKIELDYDDGTRYYDFEFCSGGYEYEYEIAAADGRILKKECSSCNHSWHSSTQHSSHHSSVSSCHVSGCH